MGIGGQKKQSLTRETILSRISEYDIFRMYISDKNWKVNQAMLSPFRQESNPSFLVGNRTGSLYFVDYVETDKRGDCFEFVRKLFHCDYDTALRMIDRDFGLGIVSNNNVGAYKQIVSTYSQPEELGKRYSLIQVVTRKFTKEELAYWNQYHQDIDDLRRENVYSISKVYLNRQLFPLKDTELRFGYLYEDRWKIYRPFEDPKKKWVPNNVPITAMDGKKDIINCDTAFINKSKKDYMVIKKVFPTTCAVQNEGFTCFSPDNIDYIRSNSKRQILSFDSDPAGVKSSLQVTEMFDFEYCNVPRTYLSDGIKDWADLSKEYGMDTVVKALKKKGIIK